MSQEFIQEILRKIVIEKQNVFLHGPGGTGKTYAIRTLVGELTAMGYSVQATALTGIAALGLSSAMAGEINQGKTPQPEQKPSKNVRGRTLHSFAFGKGGWKDGPVKAAQGIRMFKSMLDCWQYTQVLFVDEVSMMGDSLITMVDHVARLVRDNQYIPHNNPGAPFGGLIVVFSGDFLQLPPVKDGFCFLSPTFETLNFHYFIFEQPQRFVKDVPWFYILQRARKGRLTAKDIELLNERYKAWTLLDQKDIFQVRPTVLYATKDDVETENRQRMDELPGEIVDFKAVDLWEKKSSDAKRDSYEREADDTINSFIQLKVGAQVMLKVNLDVDDGKVNGSRGVILEIIKTGDVLPQVKVKWYLGEPSIVSPYCFMISDKKGTFTRIQIPLVLAWSTTIHKSQGVSLDCVVADLGYSIFCGGMAYVVLSRVRTIEGLFLSAFVPGKVYAHQSALRFVEDIEDRALVEYIHPAVQVLKN